MIHFLLRLRDIPLLSRGIDFCCHDDGRLTRQNVALVDFVTIVTFFGVIRWTLALWPLGVKGVLEAPA